MPPLPKKGEVNCVDRQEFALFPRILRATQGCKSALRSETIKMTTEPVLTRDCCLDYRRSSIGITSQFLDCDRVGGQGAEREAKQRREERAGQALASVTD